jgi:nucleoside-diphosphate-sugar epimerase
VYTSSSGIVFSGVDLKRGTEDIPYTTNPMDEYTVTKIAAEKAVLAANGKQGLATVALRPSGIFGSVLLRYIIADNSILSKTWRPPDYRQNI